MSRAGSGTATDAPPRFTLGGVTRRYRRGRTALDGLDLELPVDRHVAVVGESGSGKSTLLRVLLGLERPDAGTVRHRGRPLDAGEIVAVRRSVGVVDQDAGGSLDPRRPVGHSVREPLDHLPTDRRPPDPEARTAELLADVGLDPAAAHRRPGAFSGGERQRVALARALATSPEVLVADEPFSALDPATRADLVALVRRLVDASGLRLLLVSHDLGVVEALCDDVVVLARGHVVETGPVGDVLRAPRSTEARALVDAVFRLPAPVTR